MPTIQKKRNVIIFFKKRLFKKKVFCYSARV